MPNLAQAMLSHVRSVHISTTARVYQENQKRDRATITPISTPLCLHPTSLPTVQPQSVSRITGVNWIGYRRVLSLFD